MPFLDCLTSPLSTCDPLIPPSLTDLVLFSWSFPSSEGEGRVVVEAFSELEVGFLDRRSGAWKAWVSQSLPMPCQSRSAVATHDGTRSSSLSRRPLSFSNAEVVPSFYPNPNPYGTQTQSNPHPCNPIPGRPSTASSARRQARRRSSWMWRAWPSRWWMGPTSACWPSDRQVRWC